MMQEIHILVLGYLEKKKSYFTKVIEKTNEKLNKHVKEKSMVSDLEKKV